MVDPAMCVLRRYKALMHTYILYLRIGITILFQGRWTALMLAAAGGHSDIVHLLLRAGAKINELDSVCILRGRELF
jgi:ankyrin repeat protein